MTVGLRGWIFRELLDPTDGMGELKGSQRRGCCGLES